MSNTYKFINADGLGDFGHAGNWVDETSPATPGPPGSADTALVETTGTIDGFGIVNTLLLDGVGGLLTSTAQISAVTLELAGTVAVSGESYTSVSGSVVQQGTSTVTLNGGSTLDIASDLAPGPSGIPATAFGIGMNAADRSTFNAAGFGTQVWLEQANAVIGNAGIATMTVSGGADLETDNESGTFGAGEVTLGDVAGGQGTLTVTGQSSSLQTSGGVDVGEGGVGALSILAGAEASIGHAIYGLAVGDLAGSSGSVLVSGAGSRLSSMGDLSIVGHAGTGSFTIASAGFAELDSLNVGDGGGPGTVLVEGAGTMLELRGYLDLGQAATGSLQVTSGAQFVQSGDDSDELGMFAGDSGSISVSGSGSSFNAGASQLMIGAQGTGTVSISAGGQMVTSIPSGLTAPYDVTAYVGFEAGSTEKGSVTINGTGSNWSATGEFDVGYYGNGVLLVEGGGGIETGNYNGVAGFVAGSQAGGVGIATITGIASTLTNSGEFVIGASGSGRLTVSAGAVVKTTVPSGSTTAGAIVGEKAGSTGTVSVVGTGSEWSVGSSLIVGDAGAGTLVVGAGATVSAASLQMAVSGTGTLNVSGTSAKLAVSGNALFGGSGRAGVTIGAGGVVSIGGTGELKTGHILIEGGALDLTKTLTVDAGQLVSGFGTVHASSIINAATVEATGGTLSFIGGMTGTGKEEIEAASTLSLSGSVSAGQETIFQSATSKLVLGAPASFAGTIYDFVKGDTIDLSKIVASSLSYSGQTLTVHESGGTSLALKFSGSYAQSSFGMTSDGNGGTVITHS